VKTQRRVGRQLEGRANQETCVVQLKEVPVNLRYFEKKLLAKQSECQAGLEAIERQARVAGQREVRDRMGDASVSQATSEALREGTIISQTLAEVQDALVRVDHGTYGTCTLCGCEIEPDRLEAVCWAAYCLKHQKEQDQANRASTQATVSPSL